MAAPRLSKRYSSQTQRGLKGSKVQRSPAKGRAMTEAAAQIASRNRTKNAGPRPTTIPQGRPPAPRVGPTPKSPPRPPSVGDRLQQLPDLFRMGR